MKLYINTGLFVFLSCIIVGDAAGVVAQITIQFSNMEEAVKEKLSALQKLEREFHQEPVRNQEALLSIRKRSIDCLYELGGLAGKAPKENNICVEIRLQKSHGPLSVRIGESMNAPVAQICVQCFRLEQSTMNALQQLMQDICASDKDGLAKVIDGLHAIAQQMVKHPEKNVAGIDVVFPKCEDISESKCTSTTKDVSEPTQAKKQKRVSL